MAPTEALDDARLAQARQLKNVPWCEQYERMISGMLYDAFTPTLEQARFEARKACHDYNNTWDPNAASYRDLSASWQVKLRAMLGRVADDEAIVEPPFVVDYGCNISLGARFYANFNLTIVDSGLVSIGDRVMVGPNVSIYTATHESEVQSRRDNIEYTRPVVIGDDVWIGGNVVVLPGVTIGRGCTIGAGSVVTKDVEEYSVAVGSPARIVKKVKPLAEL